MKNFENIVGQERAKTRLNFYIENYSASSFVPNLLFIAPKGCGKTTLAKAFAKNIASFKRADGSPRDYFEINCAQIKSVAHFFNTIVTPIIQDKEVTILFDEASELPAEVQMVLLTILNPNEEKKNVFCYEDNRYEFNFLQQTFLFATTEAHKLFHALIDRLVRIDMEEYSLANLACILTKKLPNVSFENGVLEEIATVLRGNGRQAQIMASDIRSYLDSKHRNNVSRQDWEVIKSKLGINPLGLNPIEIQLLNAIQRRGHCTLTNLSASTGLTRECIQRDFEMYIQKLGLMEIVPVKGRVLTQKGRDYVKCLAP